MVFDGMLVLSGSVSLEYLSLFELQAVLEGSCLFVSAHIISQRLITGCVFDAGCKLRLSQITYQRDARQ